MKPLRKIRAIAEDIWWVIDGWWFFVITLVPLLTGIVVGYLVSHFFLH